MSDFEIITDDGRRRRRSSFEKLLLVAETLDVTASISVVTRRNGVAPNLLSGWRRSMPEGGAVAVSEEADVKSHRALPQMEDASGNLNGNSDARRWRSREPMKRATIHAQKTDPACTFAAEGRVPMRAVAWALGAAR